MKIVKKVTYIVLSILLVLLFSTIWNFDNSSAFDTISTFLSITIGFTITALSIIATSSFSKYLYSLEDEKNNSKTLLHILIGQFKISTIIFIITIGLILIYKFIPTHEHKLFCIKSYPISFSIIIKATIWYMTIISFITFLKLFETFSKFVLKSATKQ